MKRIRAPTITPRASSISSAVPILLNVFHAHGIVMVAPIVRI